MMLPSRIAQVGSDWELNMPELMPNDNFITIYCSHTPTSICPLNEVTPILDFALKEHKSGGL